jgi:hypothetical protein
MGNGERVKIYLPDAKVFAGFNLLHPIAQCLGTFARLVVANVQAFANVSVMSFGGNVDRAINRSQQHAQATGVIPMFVRDQNSVELLHIFADQRQTARDFFGAQSGIDENTCIAGNDQNRIPR